MHAYLHFLCLAGVLDSSGVEFFYTSNPPVHEAGILTLGHSVSRKMVIPPKADNFVIQSACPAVCTQNVSTPYKILLIICSI